MSHCPRVFVEMSILPRLLWRRLQEAPVFWLELCPKCCHFFGIVQTNFDIAFVCRINVVEHRHQIWSFLKWILDFASSDMSVYASCRREWKHLVVRAKWITLLGLPNSIFGKSMFIPSAIQFCCPTVGWIWFWDSNTQRRIWEHVNFHPDQFCCCITQQRNAWSTKCLPILRYLHVVCSCAFDQCLHLPLHGLHKIWCSCETFCSSPFASNPRDPCSAKIKPTSSRLWTGSRSIYRVESRTSLRVLPVAVQLSAGSSNFLMYSYPSAFAWRWTFPSPVFNGSLETVATTSVDHDNARAVMVSVWRSCWHMSSRSESPPALWSGGSTVR